MPAVEACVVVAAPDDRLGEVPVAFVESRASLTQAEVKEFLSGQVAAYKIPVRVRCVPAGQLPRGEYGKWDRKEMRRVAQEWEQWAST
jgi:fatty-acyl-CoA synthase